MAVDSTTRISNAQSAATRAEREAAERIQESQKRIAKATQDEEKQIDGIRDQYEKRSEVERARGENYIETVRNRNYESIGELRKKSETEAQRISRTAEKELKDLEASYDQSVFETRHRGEAELGEATKKGFEAAQLQRKKNADELQQLASDYELNKRVLEDERNNTTTAMTKATQEHRKTTEARTRSEIEQSNEHYQGVYEGAMKQNHDAIKDINWRASREVEDLKRDTALKLDAYSSQKTDPFYRMVNINAALRETDDNFVLTAQIPPHERDKININVRGNELVISGKRKSEETLEASPGHTLRTNAYQSFSESFPLGWPVDPKFMTREWAGDELTVRIPKRSTYEAPRPKKEVERAVLERPNFPKNLPTEERLAVMNSTAAEEQAAKDAGTPPSRRKPGKTLS